jgi:dUTP pyrophosphatase
MIKFIRTFDHDLPLPSRGAPHSAGLDLCANLMQMDVTIPGWNKMSGGVFILPGERMLIKTGWSWDLPRGCDIYGRIAPRSGLANKYGIDVLAGVIDEDYQGEIGVILLNTGDEEFHINHGDRIAQLIIEQCVLAKACESFGHSAVTDRGAGGFGSTGE